MTFKALVVFAAAIYTIFLTQGLVFERLHNMTFFKDGAKIRWSFPEGVLLFTITGNLVFAAIGILIYKPPPCVVPQKMFVMMAFPMFLAAGCTYFSMSYVDYPTVTLFKSAKPLAVLLVAMIACQHQVYSNKLKVMVIFVSIGLVLFFFGKEGSNEISSSATSSTWAGVFGYFGLLAALSFDGLAALVAVRISKFPHPASPYHMQLYMNLWSLGIVFTYCVISGRIFVIFKFIAQFSSVLKVLSVLGVLNGLGQLFIFATITTFDPLVLSLITTTRKVFTIVLSAAVYRHSLNAMQWIAVCCLFFGLIWRDTYNWWKGRKPQSTEEIV